MCPWIIALSRDALVLVLTIITVSISLINGALTAYEI